MTTEHDEALVERVALAMRRQHFPENNEGFLPLEAWKDADNWRILARAVIYPPAPPKTRLQVARELLAMGHNAREAESGTYDNTPAMHAILAALALPAMED